jgi:hypothetical protein
MLYASLRRREMPILRFPSILLTLLPRYSKVATLRPRLTRQAAPPPWSQQRPRQPLGA